jgi:acyl-CoA thioesterase I
VQRKIYVVGGLVAILVALFFIFSGKADIKNYPPKDGPIVAFGDSLVQGVGASNGNDLVSLLSAKIGEPIINLGVSGNTTAQGLARIDEVLEKEPRLVILLLGGNDYLRKVPLGETFSNLRRIITRLQSQGAVILLLGVRGGLISDKFDSYYEDLAEETGSAHVSDVLDGLIADQRYMSDAIHPNDVGYARIAERIYPVLKKLVQ